MAHLSAGSGPANPTDPVCGMAVAPAAGKSSADFEGQTYFFWVNAGCSGARKSTGEREACPQ